MSRSREVLVRLACMGLMSTSTRSSASPRPPSSTRNTRRPSAALSKSCRYRCSLSTEQRVLALVLQRLQAHLAEHVDEVGDEPDRLLKPRVRDDRHAVERLQIRGLVEPQAPRPLRERLAVHVVVLEEELARVHVGHVLAGHDQRERDVPQAVAAAVGVVLGLVQPLDEPAVDAQIALQAPLERLRVLPVIARADVLPPGGDEDVAGEVEDGQRDVEGGGEAVAQALDSVQIDQTGQLIPLAPHRALPFRMRRDARARRPPAPRITCLMVTRDTPVANAQGGPGRGAAPRGRRGLA